MPALSWHTLVPRAILRLRARSANDSVISGELNESSSHSSTRLETSWAGRNFVNLQEGCERERQYDFVPLSPLCSQQQCPGLSGAPGHPLPPQQAAETDTFDTAGNELPQSKPVLDGVLPGTGKHRRTGSAASDISLVSANGNTSTAAYTGFTQSGHYDLAQDVILRGEFITASQSKVGATASSAVPFSREGGTFFSIEK